MSPAQGTRRRIAVVVRFAPIIAVAMQWSCSDWCWRGWVASFALTIVVTSNVLYGQTTVLPYAQARRAFSGLAESVKVGLPDPNPLRSEAEWGAWIVQRERDVRGRLERGDQDTIVNWLLLGTSFTKHPPALTDATRAKTGLSLSNLITARTRDLIEAVSLRPDDERRLFARTLLKQRGLSVEIAAQRDAVEQYLVGEIRRSGLEWLGYVREMETAAQPSDARQAPSASSSVFRTRGLSTDTSLLPNFAIEQSLQQMKNRGSLSEHGVRRVAVVGPGLDFADKRVGYDFYPPQTVQPFALLDALLRLNLADRLAGVELVTLDINPRITDHLQRARDRAERGVPYTLNLPLDVRVPWSSEFKEYWKRVGDQIGASGSTPVPTEIANQLDVRVVTVRPEIVSRMWPETVDVVIQRLSSVPFDLIVATNVFVYYDLLDQSLALANIEAMLRPGGFLLSNNPLPKVSTLQMRDVGSNTVQYSPDDWDSIMWYQRSPN